MPRTLIVTQEDYDLHAIAVAQEVVKLGGEVDFLDVGKIAERTVVFDPHRTDFEQLSVSSLADRADSYSSVWLRRPSYVTPFSYLDEEYKPIVEEEWRYFLIGFWDCLENSEVPIVSMPSALRRAESKMIQLRTAAQFGAVVPKTLITNDHDRLAAFAEGCANGMIAKKLKSHQILRPDGSGAIFITKKISADQITADQLHYCPIVFQEAIDIAFDVRIVVIGSSVFAFRIDSRGQQQQSGMTDYRASGEGLREMTHTHYVPPDDVADCCRSMLRTFGLNFGAFDYAIDRDGNHVFLELNPNGQWLWLQVATRFPLTICMARYLLGMPIEPG